MFLGFWKVLEIFLNKRVGTVAVGTCEVVAGCTVAMLCSTSRAFHLQGSYSA